MPSSDENKKTNIKPASPVLLQKNLADAYHPENIDLIQEKLDKKAIKQVAKDQNLDLITYKQCFYNLVELETEVAVSLQLFHKKQKALAKEQLKTNLDQDAINGYKEQLTALASSTNQVSLSLVNYYQGYQSKDQVKKYQQISDEFSLYLKDETFKGNAQGQSLLNWMNQQAKEQGGEIIDALLKASKMRDAISNVNLARTYWIYCHLTVNQIIAVGEKFNIVNLNSGNAVIKDLNVLNPVINPTSVVFYGARFLIDSLLLLKHTIWPTEKEADLYWTKRLSKEWETKKISIINNITWGITNLLTNYTFANLPLANQLTAAVMIVDVAIASWARAEAKKKYNKTLLSFKNTIKELIIKNTELEKIIKDLEYPLKKLTLASDKEKQMQTQNLLRCKKESHQTNIKLLLTKEKVAVHENNWQISDKVYKFNKDATIMTLGAYISIAAPDLALLIPSLTPFLAPVLAFAGMGLVAFQVGKHSKPLAGLLTAGFTAAYILCPPVALLISFTIGLVAMAIYLSNKEISQLNKAKQNYRTFAAEILGKENETHEQTVKRIKTMSHIDIKEKISGLKNSVDNLAELDKLNSNIDLAKYNLAKSMLEKTLVPVLIFFTFAVCWPAAVAMIVTYLAVKFYQSNKMNKRSNEKNLDNTKLNADNRNSFYQPTDKDTDPTDEDVDISSNLTLPTPTK